MIISAVAAEVLEPEPLSAPYLLRKVWGKATGEKRDDGTGFDKVRITPVMTSRGCPFDCKFRTVTAMFGGAPDPSAINSRSF